MTHAQLVEAIEAHLARTGESATAFGKRIANDGNLVADLKAGRSPRLRFVERIMEAVASEAAS